MGEKKVNDESRILRYWFGLIIYMLFIAGFIFGFIIVLTQVAVYGTSPGEPPFELNPNGWINYLRANFSIPPKISEKVAYCLGLSMASPTILGAIVGGCVATFVPPIIAWYIIFAVLAGFLVIAFSGASIYYVATIGASTAPYIGGAIAITGVVVIISLL